MNYIYEIKFFKNKSFLVEEFSNINDNFKYCWTDLEIHEKLTNRHYYNLNSDSDNSLNRIIIWLKENYPEILI